MFALLKRPVKHAFLLAHSIQHWIQPQQKILLLGHMRCGSSLLSNILATNPEITGYGETHLDYQTPGDRCA